MLVFFVFLLGLILGSFSNVLIYRVPRKISLLGRSYCPKCRKKIRWFDNIPLVSFFLLKGKCRYCLKKISYRYFGVELASGLLFLLAYFLLPASYWLLFAFLCPIFLALFVIDWESLILPDELIFGGIIIAVLFFLDSPFFWKRLLTGLISGLFLLTLYSITHGKGMGLGDVKLALLGGFILGPDLSLIWLTFAFLTGAVFGIILILIRKAKLKSRIAFGPFLILAFFWFFLKNTGG